MIRQMILQPVFASSPGLTAPFIQPCLRLLPHVAMPTPGFGGFYPQKHGFPPLRHVTCIK